MKGPLRITRRNKILDVMMFVYFTEYEFAEVAVLRHSTALPLGVKECMFLWFSRRHLVSLFTSFLCPQSNLISYYIKEKEAEKRG